MPEMIALRRQRYGKQRLTPGDKFTAAQRDVPVLKMAKLARLLSANEMQLYAGPASVVNPENDAYAKHMKEWHGEQDTKP